MDRNEKITLPTRARSGIDQGTRVLVGRRYILGTMLILGLAWTAPAVHAQEPRQGDTVVDRPRPKLDAQGVRLGGMWLYPSLGLSWLSDDNIFATEQDTVRDNISVIEPRLRLDSDWPRHRLRLEGRAKLGRYADNENEDYDDFSLAAIGGLEISRRARLSGSLRYEDKHEDRSSPDDVNGLIPTEYALSEARASFRRGLRRVILTLDGRFRSYDFENVPGPEGLISNNDRNRDERLLSLQVGYELSPGNELFLRAAFDARDYEQSLDDNGFARSSDGYEIDIGAAFDVSGTVTGEVFVGFLSREYDDPRFSTPDDLAFGAKLIWNPTGLTTITGSLERDIQETTLGPSSGYRETRAGLRVDHELMRNLLLHVALSAADDKYRGSDREDEKRSYTAGAQYLVNRRVRLMLEYAGDRRDSQGTLDRGRDYRENVLKLTFLVQL